MVITENINLEELLEEYRHRGYTLNNRVSPQPEQQGSWEQQIVRILWNTGSVTVPLNDPIYIALLFIFYLSEEGLIFTLNPILPFGNRNVLGEDLDKIFNALEIYYGNWEVYWKITSLCTFDPNTGILKYGR